jgi:hypothetical protein
MFAILEDFREHNPADPRLRDVFALSKEFADDPQADLPSSESVDALLKALRDADT